MESTPKRDRIWYDTLMTPPKFPIARVIRQLQFDAQAWPHTTLYKVTQETKDPFKVLVSTVLSARTKDETTEAASKRLFELASTPRAMAQLQVRSIAKAIYPVGFYKTKARNVRALCHELLDRYNGKVPASVEELVTLPGVGRKTANLVITMGFHMDGICVDVHVHRISNRWGIIKTHAPEETEFALYDYLPRKYWQGYNDLLVAFGQNICRPISPRCSQCSIAKECPKINVTTQR